MTSRETRKCPHCGASIEVNVEGRESVFCNYCGNSITVDDDSTTKNINIKKDVKVHKRYTNDADIIRAQTESKKDRNDLVTFLVIIGVFFLIAMSCLVVPKLIKDSNENAGKISAGYYRDLVGEDYKTVEAHFRAAGFTDIELIDLDDSGVAFWSAGNVEKISVGGNTSFDSTDYFEPDTKVVISYH